MRVAKPRNRRKPANTEIMSESESEMNETTTEKRVRKAHKAYTPAQALKAIEKLKASVTTPEMIISEIAERRETVEADAEAAKAKVLADFESDAASDPELVAKARNTYTARRIRAILDSLPEESQGPVKALVGVE